MKKMIFFGLAIIFFVSLISEIVEATNITLYPREELVGNQFPTGTRNISRTPPPSGNGPAEGLTTRIVIWPGEFDQNAVQSPVCSIDADAGQWQPNETIGNTTGQCINGACVV